MSKSWDDLFSESPSPEHAAKVMDAVAPILEKASRRSTRRKAFGWLWSAGLGTVAASFGVLTFLRVKPNREESRTPGALTDLAPFMENSRDIADAALVVEENENLDFELLADLDLMDEIRDDELKG